MNIIDSFKNLFEPELVQEILACGEVKNFKEELKNMKPEDFFKDLKKEKGGE